MGKMGRDSLSGTLYIKDKSNDRTEENDFKMKENRFILDIMKKFFSWQGDETLGQVNEKLWVFKATLEGV